MGRDFSANKNLALLISIFCPVIHAVSVDFEGEVIAVHGAVGDEIDDGQGGEIVFVSVSCQITAIGILRDERYPGMRMGIDFCLMYGCAVPGQDIVCVDGRIEGANG